MGMFTTITDKDGRNWQFQTGYDQCETYTLGCTIPEEHFYAPPESPGYLHLGDGIYDAVATSGADDCAWVVIKEGAFAAITPFERTEDGIKPSYLTMLKQWKPLPPADGLWTQEQWAAYAVRQAARARADKMREAEMEHMSAEERLVYLSHLNTKAKLGESGFMRAILPFEPDEPVKSS